MFHPNSKKGKQLEMERSNYKRMQSDQNARYAFILTADAGRYAAYD